MSTTPTEQDGTAWEQRGARFSHSDHASIDNVNAFETSFLRIKISIVEWSDIRRALTCSTFMEMEMNSFWLTAAALVLVTGTAFAPAIAAAPPGPGASSLNDWPGMTESSSSGYVTDAATLAPYPVYAMHHTAPVQNNYDPYTGRNVADPQASPTDGPGQFIPRTR